MNFSPLNNPSPPLIECRVEELTPSCDFRSLVIEYFYGLDRIPLPRELDKAQDLLAKIPRSTNGNLKITLAKYDPNDQVCEAYKHNSKPMPLIAIEELSKLSFTANSNFILCDFYRCLVLISPNSNETEIANIIDDARTQIRKNNFELIDSEIQNDNPAWFE